MGYTIIKQQDHNNTYYTEFVIDDETDLTSLPTSKDEVGIGSAAICISNSEVYMLDTHRRWRKL